MYFNHASFPDISDDLTMSGLSISRGGTSVLGENPDGNWAVKISVSGLPVNPEFLTLFANIHDLYVVGTHRVDPLQEEERIDLEIPWQGPFQDETNISKWSRTTWSGVAIGEMNIDEPVDYPFDLTFSGMMRHFSSNDGFWFGSTCIRFNAGRGPYVAYADYPATGEDSWFETAWIREPVDMLFVEKYDFGRILVPTTISGLLILDTETTFASPYPKSDLSALTLPSGVFVTGLDTTRTY